MFLFRTVISIPLIVLGIIFALIGISCACIAEAMLNANDILCDAFKSIWKDEK